METSVKSSVQMPSVSVLGEIGVRAFKFIYALGTQPEIREIMARHGYTQEDQAEGWKLLHKAGGADLTVPGSDRSALEAIKELDEWDEVGFHKAHAALSRKFPEQGEFLFYELAASQGPTAMLGITKFLDRIDALEKGRTPATEDADKKSVLELAARGLDANERARLRELLNIVQTAQSSILSVNDPNTTREQDLAALYAWYTQWTEVAHAVVTVRAQQILLGIAKRRARPAPAAAPTPSANGAVVNAPAPNA